jgi:hypothetical protein
MELVTRSFKIAWQHKYLWLLALFAGETAGGFNFNYTSTTPPGKSTPPNITAINQQVSQWLASHAGLIIGASAAVLLIAIAFFVLGAVCEGAVVRAAAEHDAERPFGLGWAWRAGTATMWAMIRFRLLLFLLTLPLVVVFVVLAIGLFGAVSAQNGALIAVLALILFLCLLVSIAYLIALFFLDRLGTRALVLEQLGAVASIRRAYALITKRLGRLLLVGLVAIAVGIVVGICLAVAGTILVIPAVVLGVAAYSSGSPVWWVVVVLAVVILLPVFLVISAFLSAQGSTYWTLAFRRLEIDRPPAYAYAYPPPQVQPPAPGLPAG